MYKKIVGDIFAQTGNSRKTFLKRAYIKQKSKRLGKFSLNDTFQYSQLENQTSKHKARGSHL